MDCRPIAGAGVGMRRGLFDDLRAANVGAFDFMELAPENWIGVGGRFKRSFDWFADRYPLVCHGLSLSLGGPEPLVLDLLRHIRAFMDSYGIAWYTEHLSACSDHGHLYDLMPVPFTSGAVEYVAKRIMRVQDTLGRCIGIEHVSYYAAPGQEMQEIDFLLAVLERADCRLLLDVNNIYVNSINHGYSASDFLRRIPPERVMYIHIAGHYDEAPDLKIDTHGAAVVEPVWQLLDLAYRHCGIKPTLLERDFNFPPLHELEREVARIRSSQHAFATGQFSVAGGRV